MIDTDDPLTLVRTYRDFLVYCDWLEEQGRNAQVLKAICNKSNYRTVLCFLYPKSILKQFTLRIQTKQGIIEEVKTRDITKLKGLIDFTFEPFICDKDFEKPYRILVDHIGQVVLKQKTNQYYRADRQHSIALVVSVPNIQWMICS